MTVLMCSSRLLAAASVATIFAQGASAMTADPLAPHLWTHRVVLVVAPDAGDNRLAQQRQLLDAMGVAARDRDLVLVTAVGNTAEAKALRARFDLGPGFHALLIGKDGGAKLRATDPLPASALLPLIDAMPMRQQEMRRPS